MAFRISNPEQFWAKIKTYDIDLYGAFEGSYILEERMICSTIYGEDALLSESQLRKIGKLEYDIYFRNEDGTRGARLQNIDAHLLILDNYRQWQKELL